MTVSQSAPILGRDPDNGMPTYRGRGLPSLQDESFERVWALLVDGDLTSALPPAEPFSLPTRTGDVRADLQSALGHLGPVWSFRPIMDTSPTQARADLARASVLTMSFVAQAARGPGLPTIPQREVDRSNTVTERFLVRWHGHADPVATHALNVLWLLVAEQGLVASTRVARLVASTGADAAACLSAASAAVAGPLAGGGAIRSLRLLHRAEELGDARAAVLEHLAVLPPETDQVPGFTPEPGIGDGEEAGLVPRADWDARSRLMHAACARMDARLLEVAEATERTMVAALAERRPHHVSGANLMFWAAVLLDHAGISPRLFNALIICGRTAGWSAHVLDAQRAFA